MDLERDNASWSITFRVGDRIFILPDPTTIPDAKKLKKADNLDDGYWWCAEIVQCCYMPNYDGENIGFLKVAVSGTLMRLKLSVTAQGSRMLIISVWNAVAWFCLPFSGSTIEGTSSHSVIATSMTCSTSE